MEGWERVCCVHVFLVVHGCAARYDNQSLNMETTTTDVAAAVARKTDF